MSMTLVTGANGHVGENLVRALVGRGERVRAFLGPSAYPGPLHGLDVERVEGDVRDPEQVREAVRGCNRVYHLASRVSIRNDDADALFEVNVRGTRHVMDACLVEGVQRVVHTSSIGTVGLEPGKPSTEETLLNPCRAALDYELTKAMGEAEALRAGARGLDVVVVNPSSVVGPHDYRPSPMGQAVLDFAEGRIPAYIPGAFDFVHVADVVRGHLLAMEHGRRGERYLLCGEHKTLDDVFGYLSDLLGRPPPRWKLSPRLMMPLVGIADRVHRLVFPQRPPVLTPGSLRVLTSGKHGSSRKARRDLGYAPTPVLQAFHDTVEWFRAHGRIAAGA